MEFLSQTYIALRGPTGAPQDPLDTIRRLADRLSPSTLLADRRAAVQALKGLSKDVNFQSEVGEFALPGLIDTLENDAEIDAEIGKAVLETLLALCEPPEVEIETTKENKNLAVQHSDALLKDERVVHKLFSLLKDGNFYIRYSALRLLSVLIANRRQTVQRYFLTAPVGPGTVLVTLDEKREIVRNEGLSLIQSLLVQSPDIQKLLAFEGAFERLFSIIQKDGGLDGGIVIQDCLLCIDSLLRFNMSNQTFFREAGLLATVCSLIYFPANLPFQEPAPQEFALQFWDDQKATNAEVTLGILGILIGSTGNNEIETNTLIRCFVELAVASNAPTSVKLQALRQIPLTNTFPFLFHFVTPYVPVPETKGEEWDKMEPVTALDALVELVIQGEYSGMDELKKKGKEGLMLRAAALAVLENYVRIEDIRFTLLQRLIPDPDPSLPPASPVLTQSLTLPPSTPLDITSLTSTHLSTVLFSLLVRTSLRCKEIARFISPSAPSAPTSGGFFVPADGLSSNNNQAAQPAIEEPDEPQTLLQVLSEHLSLCFLSRSHTTSADNGGEARNWDRLIVAYLTLLSQWLWEEPKAVREFLENGGMGVLVEPINQTTNVDPVVQGLCAFLLGVCYEFNREPGEITRVTMHAILARLGVDTLIGRMSRLREDQRFKSVTPEDIVLPSSILISTNSARNMPTESGGGGSGDDYEIWFNWAFVDFWKSNYYTVQRAITLDPNTLSSADSEHAEAAAIIASYRDIIDKQAAEIEILQARIMGNEKVWQEQTDAQQIKIDALTSNLDSLQLRKGEMEKEQEDLLVLLDDINTKRKRDKILMRNAGLEVSEDEEEDDGE